MNGRKKMIESKSPEGEDREEAEGSSDGLSIAMCALPAPYKELGDEAV